MTFNIVMGGYEYSKKIPQCLSYEKRKTALLFAEVERLKKGEVQVEFGQVKWWVIGEVAANEDLELKRDAWAGAMGVMNF